MFYKWTSSPEAHTVAPRLKKYELMFNPNTPAAHFPDPIKLKVILDLSDPGAYLDALSVSVAYPKILSERAIRETLGFLGKSGRIITCDIPGAPMKYFAWIPTIFIDALDFERSTITKTAFVTTVRTAVLKKASVGDCDVFCIANLPFAGVFVSGRFAEVLAKISGIQLIPVSAV